MSVRLGGFNFIFSFAIVAMMTACGPAPSGSDSNNESVRGTLSNSKLTSNKAALWEVLDPSKAGWSQSLTNQIVSSGLLNSRPRDVASFCPAYSRLSSEGKLRFWVRLMSAIAYKESGFRPSATYVETTSSGAIRGVSRGLLQLGLSSTRYYRCGFNQESDLHDARGNLACGVRIMSHWIKNDDVISGRAADRKWLGGARYWAVLRTPSLVAWIKKATSSLPDCAK